MGRDPQLTSQTVNVLMAFTNAYGSELSGADIGRLTKLPSGSLYPILLRLEKAGWLESHWELGDPSVLGRPRRRFYSVTALGAAKYRAYATPIAASLNASKALA